MKPKDLINKVSKIADTLPKHSHITVTDVSRVQSLIFQELSSLPSDELFSTLGSLLALGAKAKIAAKEAKKKAKGKSKTAAKKK